MADAPTVAIIIPTADARSPQVRRCLQAIERTTSHLGARVIPVESSGPEFRFSRSVNRGFAAAPDAPAWVVLNDDTVMATGWLDALLATAAAHPEAGLVGACLESEDGADRGVATPLRTSWLGAVWESASRYRSPKWAAARLARGPSPLRRIRHHPGSPTQRRMRIDYLGMACVLVTRRCRDAVGDLDEDFPFTFEDVDYSLRARAAGFDLAVATQARGLHDGGATASGNPATSARSAASYRLFAHKWPVKIIRRVTRGRRGVYHPGLCGHGASPAGRA